MKRLLAATCLSLVACSVWASIEVSIIDCPDRVLSHSPVFVTAALENTGAKPVLVPVNSLMANGYFFETGEAGGPLVRRSALAGTTTSGRVVWLRPKERWLFQADLRPWLTEPGQYRVRAGLRSSGVCLYRATGNEPFPLKRMPSREGELPQYECWEGEDVSLDHAIEILPPDEEVDRQAREYMLSEESPSPVGGPLFLRLTHAYPALKERYPTSHYTYVSGFYGQGDRVKNLEDLLELQPHNPLNTYAWMVRAHELLGRHGGDVPGLKISELDMSKGLQEFLLQKRGLYRKEREDGSAPHEANKYSSRKFGGVF